MLMPPMIAAPCTAKIKLAPKVGVAAFKRPACQQASESRADAGDDIHDYDHAIDIDAGCARRVGIRADGVHVAAAY